MLKKCFFLRGKKIKEEKNITNSQMGMPKKHSANKNFYSFALHLHEFALTEKNWGQITLNSLDCRVRMVPERRLRSARTTGISRSDLGKPYIYQSKKNPTKYP